jgi:seryl-tRNA synthetase
MDLDVPVAVITPAEAWNDLIKNAYWLDSNIECVSRVEGREDVVRIRYSADTLLPATLQAVYNLSAEIARSYQRVPVEEIFRYGDFSRRAVGPAATPILLERGVLRFRRPGYVESSGVYLDLLRLLDSYVLGYALELGAKEFQFPSTLPLAVAERCGVLDNYPHQVCSVHTPLSRSATENKGSCGSEETSKLTARLAGSDTILSPAVCYHFWCHPAQLQCEKPGDTYLGTAVGRCYRAEVKALMGLDRLQEFNMREIFAVGDLEQLSILRKDFLEFVQQMMIRFELWGRIQTASDPFFVNVYAKKRLFQANLKLKYELLAWLPDRSEMLAVASINDHRDHFTRAFGLTSERGAQVHSSCLAFGLERLALAIIAQHGLEPGNWPVEISRLLEQAAVERRSHNKNLD